MWHNKLRLTVFAPTTPRPVLVLLRARDFEEVETMDLMLGKNVKPILCLGDSFRIPKVSRELPVLTLPPKNYNYVVKFDDRGRYDNQVKHSNRVEYDDKVKSDNGMKLNNKMRKRKEDSKLGTVKLFPLEREIGRRQVRNEGEGGW